jgi:hypothetical protein
MRNKKVKVALGILVVAAAVAAVQVRFSSGALPRVHAQERAREDERESCSLETLKGGYGLTFTGLVTSGPVPAPITAFIPVAGVGAMTFDGNGNLSLSETVSFGGSVTPLITTGTYTVNPDCTGSLQAVNAADVNFVIVQHGKEILAVNTDQGHVATVNFKKQ